MTEDSSDPFSSFSEMALTKSPSNSGGMCPVNTTGVYEAEANKNDGATNRNCLKQAETKSQQKPKLQQFGTHSNSVKQPRRRKAVQNLVVEHKGNVERQAYSSARTL